SKAALNCMTKSLARAFGPKVRVNAVAPGPVLTRWLADHRERVERYIQVTPLQRAATPDDIADVAVFLALGTTLMTGQVIVADGGRTMCRSMGKGKRKECRHCVLPNFFLLPFPLAFSMADLAAHPAFLATDFPSSRAATSATHSQASETS